MTHSMERFDLVEKINKDIGKCWKHTKTIGIKYGTLEKWWEDIKKVNINGTMTWYCEH